MSWKKDSVALIIAECVNQHDKLVDLNKELVEALKFRMCDLDPKVASLIKRAKELNK